MSPEDLIGMLAELERIRELTLDLIEREAPRLLPAPPDEAGGTERTVFDLLLGARRAVLGNPAAARGCTTSSLPRAAATQTHPAGRSCATRWSPPKQWRTYDASGRR